MESKDASDSDAAPGPIAPSDGRIAEPILTGLIGTHIQGSRSPEMHMREADALGLRLAYKLFDLNEPGQRAEDLPGVLDAVERAGFSGVNITHPFKQQVIPLLHSLSEEARRIGAVNTVLFRGGGRIGHNTDWSGFAEGFERQLPGVSLRKAIQLGAGGAGAATAMAMLHMGCRDLAIFDSEPDRAAELVARLEGSSDPGRIRVAIDVDRELGDADGLINATPVGMDTHPGLPVPAGLLRTELWVADVVYFPLETALLREARARGCRTADGGGMAIFQAARAFDLFTGRHADRTRMVANFAGG